MEVPDSKKASLIIRAGPLIIYEITFTLFVIYYIRDEMIWFKLSFFSIVLSFLTSFGKILFSYRDISSESNKKINELGHFFNFIFFAVYLFCLLVQTDQSKLAFAPHLIIIPCLAIPPLAAFVLFLYSDSSRNHDISK
jgi:hypothetical protein